PPPPPRTASAALPLAEVDDLPLEGDLSPAISDPEPASAGGTSLVEQDLAAVLSSLQRASGHSLRELAARTQLSPSFLSRLMTGERFPSWRATLAIAKACGADPDVLRMVWEDAHARRSAANPRPATLAGALRYLHARAGSPSPDFLVLDEPDLTPDLVTGLLAGTLNGTWEQVCCLIHALDGEKMFFRELWEAEVERGTPTPAVRPMPSTETQNRTRTRVEGLLAVFGGTLCQTLPHTGARRPLPTPIQGATTWPTALPSPPLPRPGDPLSP
ncbi:helix-turn-helix domain-containing protein, partial [Streptomyces alkaliterrae]